jgi:carbamoyl-phosphate synthase small subunit
MTVTDPTPSTPGPSGSARRPSRRPVPALLVLEDGATFTGSAFGAVGETFGEAVFSTGMSGYQETLTDPSYHRQVVVATAPHIGNTGWNDEDDESSRIWVAGYVVRDAARVSSSWRSRRSLDDELAAQGVVGMCDVDTRALTRHLRERGAMRVGVSSVETDPAALLARVRSAPQMSGAHLADEVTTPRAYVVPAMSSRSASDGSSAEGRPPSQATEPRFRVAAVDLGIKSMTPYRLAERGVETHVLPATTTWSQVEALHPDGVFFSNGPGDPAATEDVVALLRSVLEAGVPFFGICFGNQLFGRALGFGTYKLGYGHRGSTSP